MTPTVEVPDAVSDTTASANHRAAILPIAYIAEDGQTYAAHEHL